MTARRAVGRGALQMAALSVLLCCLLASVAQGQQPLPILGQNTPPDGVTQVVADVIFDSLESINQQTNSWSGVVWFHFMWQDSRAETAIMDATDQWINATINSRSTQAGGCTRPCDSSWHQQSGCCDLVWLPHIDLPNLMKIDQESVYKYRVWLEPAKPGSNSTNVSTGMVHWMVRLTGTFHSPYDFRAWPFEHQHLLIELQVQPSIADRVIIAFNDVAFLKNTPHTKGELVPGWWVAKVTRHLYDTSACYRRTGITLSHFDVNSTTTDAVFDPLPPDGWAQLTYTNSRLVVTKMTADGCQQYMGFYGAPMDPEAMCMYTPQIHVVDVMVKRAKGYFVLATLVPLLVLTYMTFVIYAMERTDLEARMGVVVTLTLAVSALQFTYDFPPANYLNAIQQLTVTAYILYGLVACESMVTAHLCRMHTRRRHLANISAMAHAPPSGNSYSGASTPFASSTALGTKFSAGGNDGGLNTSRGPLDTATTGFRRGAPVDRLALGDADVMVETVGHQPSTLPLINNRKVQGQPIAEGTEALGMRMGGRAGTTTGAEGLESHSSQVPVLATDAYAASSSAFTPGGMNGNNPHLRKPTIRIELPAIDAEAGKGPSTANPNKKAGKGVQWHRAISRHLSKATNQLGKARQRLDRDEAYTLLFAARLDSWFCWTLLILYTVTVIVLLWVNTQVGDHKLMLNGTPANM